MTQNPTSSSPEPDEAPEVTVSTTETTDAAPATPSHLADGDVATAETGAPEGEGATAETGAPEGEARTAEAGEPEAAQPEADGATAGEDEPAAAAPTAEADEPAAGGSASEAEEPAADADEIAAPAPEADAPAEEARAAVTGRPADDAAAPADGDAEPSEAATPADEPAAPADEAPAATPSPAPAPRPTPGPHPTPASIRPVPRPPAVQAPSQPAAAAPAAPVAPPVDAAEAAHAATFGRVDEEGTVYVREAAGERAVGQFPGASTEEALALYVRRFLDVQAKVSLFEQRLGATDLSIKEIDQTLARLTEEVAEPAAVGNLDGLRARLEALRGTAAERRAVAEAERAAARETAVAARTAIVEQAEKIASTDPSRIQWRPAGEQLRALLDQWKDAQRSGPRLDRPTEESLWKRFSHARTTFDRERRHFFAELESRNTAAKDAKERLVAEAESLSSSTDWGATAGQFRDLMTQWKAAGRASRADDDALWARFRAAQDTFFAARDAQAAATDTEFRANLEVKEQLLSEAEALVPVRDLAAAKASLRSIQDRWEAAGKVPRGDIQRIEGRLRAVESAVREADQSQWRRTNPETRARAEGAAAQLEQAIAGLEADLAQAKAAGDARKIADAQAALDARRAWLEQVQRAAQDARG
ncbi:DUF349 domain-containing protein [Cellulomonas alba]|uniref:DUF349 domain-containing protein n=1 Tax=Cellulomonas alba TaxID=3053467 RepID=A0ABT7SB67_9CELL|nr:DUF349 domain-containing protein [Cellulomonas alba]MDM7853434.1 DUF349 domain-containing protein [Cellulomonas alba]